MKITAGMVSIDDHNVAELTLENLRTALNVIPQDPYLGNSDTLRATLALKDTNTKDKHIRHALEKVDLWPKIQSRGGLDGTYKAGEWSHGERQLLCVARAILKKSKVVLLDEATSK